MDLKDLPPNALRAAMETGTTNWGRHGSATQHALYVSELPKKKTRKGRRMCRCGCRRMATHLVMANGVGLASGCELEARRAMKQLQKYRGR